jgi:hypothetical protein
MAERWDAWIWYNAGVQVYVACAEAMVLLSESGVSLWAAGQFLLALACFGGLLQLRFKQQLCSVGAASLVMLVLYLSGSSNECGVGVRLCLGVLCGVLALVVAWDRERVLREQFFEVQNFDAEEEALAGMLSCLLPEEAAEEYMECDNHVFEWNPLAARVEGTALCLVAHDLDVAADAAATVARVRELFAMLDRTVVAFCERGVLADVRKMAAMGHVYQIWAEGWGAPEQLARLALHVTEEQAAANQGFAQRHELRLRRCKLERNSSGSARGLVDERRDGEPWLEGAARDALSSQSSGIARGAPAPLALCFAIHRSDMVVGTVGRSCPRWEAVGDALRTTWRLAGTMKTPGILVSASSVLVRPRRERPAAPAWRSGGSQRGHREARESARTPAPLSWLRGAGARAEPHKLKLAEQGPGESASRGRVGRAAPRPRPHP